MKKLEDIPKNHPFKVPDGYFDKLPGVIQARIAEQTPARESKPYLRYALQYALPVLILGVAALFYLLPSSPKNTESLLASVSTEELVAYLEESEITTEELLDQFDLNAENLEAIEDEVYSNFDGLEGIDELDLDF
jgi:hypothetical protein